MAIPKIRDEILEELSRLPEAFQLRVLEVVRSLAVDVRSGTPVEDLLALSGGLDAESAREMKAAIEAGCERVDLDAW